ncbi:hypothetical protein JQX09_22585 [Sulfitobacter pseudonitzschiae]|uniref:Uncharacterized protein n=1 Tax=Pseudosulfitobacter pseudonitzschiae TaxID=1402135 RepID=A0A9Q2NKC0_9RHOB|nr:hypothetical protein [Pseudosulfitobacter pseudonitzschiae]MBM1833731.1 hypothetical protein [Pseudosulfitobacter pseudonitzschiae]MBM1838597.1 hypothetical protein [Pseudosulfitobacter pseudonitzschiae]MBM1842945.1 hypothetical protein [Pseudosulfitobacter pseudonitzschiae]MBM1847811.1 hypothetical protein [Pseudosulfitobacter pseudonitzschiae]MBM1853153.1 hypothetical protein [Pseudosulfitobacter pseudonitzschiae]
MKDIQRLSEAEILRLAASGVAKVDLMGARGTTLCTMDEIEAMAALIVLAGALPGYPTDAERQPRFAALEASS